MIKQGFARIFRVFAYRQTYLNAAYLLAGFACGLIDLILFSVTAAIVLGLVGVPIWVADAVSLDSTATAKTVAVALCGVLIVPASMLLWFFPALLEQQLAAWLLDLRFSIRAFWTVGDGVPGALLKYIVSGAAWRRFLFGLTRIPLGFLSFLAVLIVVPAVLALLSIPAVYLAGYHDLIVWKWRIDSLGECLAVFLLALILAPVALHALNLLTRAFSAFARLCLQD